MHYSSSNGIFARLLLEISFLNISFHLGQKKDVTKFEQTSQGGWPQHPNGRKGGAARDSGINWDGHKVVKFEVRII